MKTIIKKYEGDGEFRFILGTEKKEKPLYVIAMNPSIADEKVFDQTVIKVFGLAFLFNFDSCLMFNLIPIREPNSTKLEQELDEDLINKNIKIIIDNIPENSIILATWGDISKNKLLKSSLKKIYEGLKDKNLKWKCPTYTNRKAGKDFNNYKTEGLTKSGHPRHLSFLKQTTLFNDFNIDEYMKTLK